MAFVLLTRKSFYYGSNRVENHGCKTVLGGTKKMELEKEFVCKFGLQNATLQDRVKMLQEESLELFKALDENDVYEAADAMVDILYVVRTTMYIMGISFEPRFYAPMTLTKLQDVVNLLCQLRGEFKDVLVNSIDCAATNKDDIMSVAASLTVISHIVPRVCAHVGIPLEELYKDVHRANMAKMLGTNAKRDIGIDIIKPEGWQGPNTKHIMDTTYAGYKND